MNKNEAISLLKKWQKNLEILQIKLEEYFKKSPSAINKVVTHKRGKPVIFDTATYNDQCVIQKQLCGHIPSHIDIINSIPELDGQWKSKDYTDLYISHYQVVIEKLTKLINK